MIQIIGFLICACLAVKLLEMSGNPALHKEDGSPRGTVALALFGGWASVVGFVMWLTVQGQAFGQTQANAQSSIDCITSAQTIEELNACPK